MRMQKLSSGKEFGLHENEPTRLFTVSLLLTLKIFFKTSPPRNLRSTKKNLLVVPAFNTNSHSRRAFSVVAPLLWNSFA